MSEKTTYKIGQILTSNRDIEVERELSGEKVVIPKGSKIIIGADKLAHHLRDGTIQPLAENIEVKGYDTNGISEFIFKCISNQLPLLEMLEYREVGKEEFRYEIENSLKEIGF